MITSKHSALPHHKLRVMEIDDYTATISLREVTLQTFSTNKSHHVPTFLPGRPIQILPSGREIRVEDAVLKRLVYFRSMEKLRERNQKTIVIVEPNVDAFAILIEALHEENWMQIARIVKRHGDNVLYISHVANKYGFSQLSVACDAVAISSLSLENAGHVFEFWETTDCSHISWTLCPDPYANATFHGTLVWLRSTLTDAAHASTANGLNLSDELIHTLRHAPSWCLLQLLEFPHNPHILNLLGAAVVARTKLWKTTGAVLNGWDRALAELSEESTQKAWTDLRPARTLEEAFTNRPTLRRFNSTESASEHYAGARSPRPRRFSLPDTEPSATCHPMVPRCEESASIIKWLRLSVNLKPIWSTVSLGHTEALSIGFEDAGETQALSVQVILHRNESDYVSISVKLQRLASGRLNALPIVGSCLLTGRPGASYAANFLSDTITEPPNAFCRPVSIMRTFTRDQRNCILVNTAVPGAILYQPSHPIGLHLALGILSPT